MQTLLVNNSRILTIKNAKLLGSYFFMNLNIWRDFQICISVPLKQSSGVVPRFLSRNSKDEFLQPYLVTMVIGLVQFG